MKKGNVLNSRRSKIRRATGGTIAEFGPALWILLICIFFPLVDILSLAVSYGLCVVLNTNQVKEAALLPRADATDPSGTVMKTIPEMWENGMGRFVKMSGQPLTEVAYRTGETGTDNITDKIVGVRTTINCNPFLSVPVPFVSCPGLNAPMVFQITSEKPMENPDNAQ
jgi:hypothetical protein